MIRRISFTLALLAAAAGLLLAQPAPPTPAELQALQKIASTQTVETRVAAADEFVKSFPKSEYRAFALTMAAEALQVSGNSTKAIVYYQQTLEADPKNYNAMLMLAAETARNTKEFDLGKEEKLNQAEKYVKEALALIPGAVKPNPQVTDAQWDALKKDDTARAHEALGLVALVRKKYDVAITEFKTATETAAEPQPATFIRLAGSYTDAGKPADAIPVLDKVLAMPNIPDQIKQIAQSEKARAEKAKNGK